MAFLIFVADCPQAGLTIPTVNNFEFASLRMSLSRALLGIMSEYSKAYPLPAVLFLLADSPTK